MNENEYITLQMNASDIINDMKKDSEAMIYLNNIIKKYPKEFNDFINKLAELKINSKILKVLAKEESPLDAVRKYSIDIVIHRLRQINCFGNPTNEYVKNVFDMTLKEISFE